MTVAPSFYHTLPLQRKWAFALFDKESSSEPHRSSTTLSSNGAGARLFLGPVPLLSCICLVCGGSRSPITGGRSVAFPEGSGRDLYMEESAYLIGTF